LPWDDEVASGKGPPSQYERHVVGAALLLFVSALTMMATARKTEKPGRVALAVAGAASLGAMALALSVRSTAMDHNQAHVLLGGGWLWMSAGTCMSVAGVVSAFTLLFRPAAASAGPETGAKPGPRSGPKSGAGPKKAGAGAKKAGAKRKRKKR
jgi:hypothetical protein